MVSINPERLIADLKHLRSFGACGSGVVRTAFSAPDLAARQWLRERFAEAGLEAWLDGIGNVIGRSHNPGPALLLGSHSDTQPRGGWLDGAMGVIYALEVARACAEAEATRGRAVDIASWMDEEHAFYGFLGSRSFCDLLPAEVVDSATDRDGRRLTDAIREAGLDGVAPARLDPQRHAAYMEAHIEQGPHLEAAGKRIGVVTAIVGLRAFTVQFTGQQNHAGTTPMALRRDAGMALIEFAHAANAKFRAAAGERTVWTFGRVRFDPGAASIIPGRAELLLQFRDPEEARLDALQAEMEALIAATDAAGPVAVALLPQEAPGRAQPMDPGLRRHLAAAAERHAPGAWMEMPSGAGHDAQVLAQQLPSAMLFVPSIGGVSHDFAEDTAEADIVLGCQVLADAAAAVLLDWA